MPIQVQLGGTPAPLDPAAEREHRRRTRFWTGAAIVVIAVAFIFILRLYAFEMYLVPSRSMDPTLKMGDYGLFDHRVALRGRWNRGDVVIFRAPQSWEQEGGEGDEQENSSKAETLVKRIIAMPGETVLVKNDDTVYINGKKLEGQSFVNPEPTEPMVPSQITLGPDQYWVMGDNRNHSDDSRNNGPITEGDIKGRVVCRLWPLGRIGGLPSFDFGPLNTNN